MFVSTCWRRELACGHTGMISIDEAIKGRIHLQPASRSADGSCVRTEIRTASIVVVPFSDWWSPSLCSMAPLLAGWRGWVMSSASVPSTGSLD